MTPADNDAALAHQAELEREEKEWRDWLDSDLHYIAWSERLRNEAEEKQSEEHK